MGLTIAYPWALALLLVLPFLHRFDHRPPTPRLRRAGSLRRASLAVIVVALSGPRISGGEAERHVVLALDYSESMLQSDFARSVMDTGAVEGDRRPGDELSVVVFGSDALLDQRLGNTTALRSPSSLPVASGTDIGAAVRLGRRILRGNGDPRIVLVTDGRDSVGGAVREAFAAAADGVRIDVIDPGILFDPIPGTITLERVDAPGRVQLEEPFSLDVWVSGSAGTNATLELERNGVSVSRERISLRFDGANQISVTDRIEESGFHSYRAVVSSGEESPGGKGVGLPVEGGAVVYASGRPRLAYVSEGSRGVALVRILEADGFDVDAIAPADLRTNAQLHEDYDVVVVDNVAATEIGPRRMEALKEWVRRDGGGFVMTGGTRSFAPGGYINTPIEEMLPVDLRVRDRRRVPRLGFALVLDKSGSMAAEEGGVSKIDVAQDAALSVSEYLDEDDLIGVLAFDREPRILVPLTPVAEATGMEQSVRALDAGGDTAIAPAIDLAYTLLETSEAADRKHVLLLSDGQSDQEDVERLLERVGGSSVSLSVVGIGSEIDRSFLWSLADRGGGQAYFPESLRELPEVFTREAIRASGDWLVEGVSALESVPGRPVLEGLDTSSIPSISGYIATTVKPSARTVLRSDLEDPIVAIGRYGLGRSAVIATDLDSRWASDLVRWADFATLWTRIVRSVTPGVADEVLSPVLLTDGGGAAIEVDAVRPDGTFLNGLSVAAAVRLPSDEVREFDLSQTGPGRYRTSIPYQRGAYRVSIVAGDDSGKFEYSASLGAYVARLPEDASAKPNGDLLEQLVRTTSGRVLGIEESAFGGPRPIGRGTEAWPWLALLAALIFLTDVGARRGLQLAEIRRAFSRHATPDGVVERS